jgi:hypothetical protein
VADRDAARPVDGKVLVFSLRQSGIRCRTASRCP